ncbi:tripartite tricarboxylate transporter TctB family protein [Paenalcaligenes niemegkensis]|uniref:tripartite tricarboxylate transporter TctB family protein n=1 Tax=Paenalcaligenes niemegkensis TaxID=2895469 RepID=UPI001EE9A929|nr:tripartite tricarboxylate transporter TctB family protein [Paenalcaligenes niemegkensis]MCQ9617702.1 tripartite tricarboxylate transporter TctB family protein [Paenalcaligenes niemegkensis]
MKNLSQKDWPSALFLLIIGLGAVLGSMDYNMGSLARMGPGYFPTLLGMSLVLMGLLLLVGPRGEESKLKGSWRGRLRPWGCAIAGMLGFVILGQYGGFMVATFALIFISAFGDSNNTFKGNLSLAVLITVATVGLFHFGLRLQLPLFVWG